MFVCMCVTYLLQNDQTCLAEFFCLLCIGQGMVFAKKPLNSGFGFSRNSEQSGHFLFSLNFLSKQFRTKKSFEGVKPFQFADSGETTSLN